MKRISILLFFTTTFFASFAQNPINSSKWKLVLEDNFDSLNTNIWRVLDWAIHPPEPQLYLDDNVSIADGNLVITVEKHKDSVECAPDQPPVAWAACAPCKRNELYNYTSGWIETYESFQYGYIEARIKMPYGYGFWPAFWTWTKGADNAAEIDIFEMLGRIESTTVMPTNVHLAYCSKNYPSYKCEELYQTICYDKNGQDIYCYGQNVDIPSYTDWRTYAVEWTPSKIVWYVDDIMVRNFPNPGVTGHVRIILNFAIDPSYSPNETTPFPSEMFIDYFRIWQIDKSYYENTNTTYYNFSTYENSVKNFITKNINSNNTSGFVNDDLKNREFQFIDINGKLLFPLENTNLDSSFTQNQNLITYYFSKHYNSKKKEIIFKNDIVKISIIPTTQNIILQTKNELDKNQDIEIKKAKGYLIKIKNKEYSDDKK